MGERPDVQAEGEPGEPHLAKVDVGNVRNLVLPDGRNILCR